MCHVFKLEAFTNINTKKEDFFYLIFYFIYLFLYVLCVKYKQRNRKYLQLEEVEL